jgi:hypothetical protein
MPAHFDIARRFGLLSRAGFVNFELIENAIPSVVEVEDRHIEHQQWIAHSAAALEHFWQLCARRRIQVTDKGHTDKANLHSDSSPLLNAGVATLESAWS